MRPLDKGPSPREFSDYADAIGPLEARLGPYCAYCELRIEMGLEVDHVVPQSVDSSLVLEWSNFLPACKCCNTVKGKKEGDEFKGHLRPDWHNTAQALEYDLTRDGLPRVSTTLTEDDQPKAASLIRLVDLDHVPSILNQNRNDRKVPLKTTRWRRRRDVVRRAETVKARYLRQEPKDSDLIASVLDAAIPCGFWSVWMTVFADAPEVRRHLIDDFPHTANCFDSGSTEPTPRVPGSAV